MSVTIVASTTHDARFDDAWLKWSWAVLHGESLYSKIFGAEKDESEWGVGTETQFDAKTNRISVRIKTINEAPKRWGLELGDVLHNYRSALDSAAWAAVSRGASGSTLTPDQILHVAFPINRDPNIERLTTASLKLIPGVTPADMEVIKGAQPYNVAKPHRARAHLAVLIEQNNLDKHKRIRPTLVSNVGYSLGLDQIITRDCDVVGIDLCYPNSLEVGTELAQVTVVPKGPHPQIEPCGPLSLSVSLHDGINLGTFLKETADWVEIVLFGFSRKPNIAERLDLA
jgi:hypothetical protein